MSRFRDYSIRVKLTLAIVLTSATTLVLSSLTYLVMDHKSFQEELVKNVTLMTDILADNCSSAVAFDDDATAEEVLQAVSSDPHIMWAVITLPDGTQFSKHVRPNETVPATLPPVHEGEYVLDDEGLTVCRSIISNNTRVASLLIRSDLEQASERLNSFALMCLIISVAATLFGLIVASFFQRIFTRPIKELEVGAKQLATGNLEYGIDYRSKDEMGRLADTFRELKGHMTMLSEAAEKVANNDLTVEVNPRSDKDILGHSFKKMIANLVQMITKLGNHADQLVSAADEIFATSEEMSGGAQNQAGQMNQMSAAIEEMTAIILQSTKNATEATKASRDASETASVGGRIVGETIEGIQTIGRVVSDSAQSIGRLAESADQIGEIIRVIDDIADQTNLLALNAAIEAARAGEQGRGFAVVADEVRKLAERTGKATSEITNVINSVQEKTSDAVQAMQSGIDNVEKGRELADQAGSSLNEIVNMSQRVMTMIEQIATASNEQSQAAEAVSQGIEAVKSETDNAAKQAVESSDAAKALNKQAAELRQIVAKFKM